jgi:hypothetical protein
MTDVFVSPTPADAALLLHALPKIFFPWEKLVPDLQRLQGKSTIPVTFADLTAFAPPAAKHLQAHAEDDHGIGAHVMYGDRVPGLPDESAAAAWGLFWFDGRIQIEQALRNQQANIDMVLSAEIAHAVDLFYGLGKNMRVALNLLVHGGGTDAHPWFGGPYWEQPGESFMAGFGLAYTDFVAPDPRFLHQFTPAMVPQVWTILQTPRTDVAPPPPTGETDLEALTRILGSVSGIDVRFTKAPAWALRIKAPGE